jgi:oligoribonuclease NrnB/cAMP/cGMP phosphodiesterase (DHH superfamily)
MKKILIISHRDLDGITSAVSYIWNHLEINNLSKNLKNISKYSDIIDYQHGEDILKILSKKKINLKNYSQLIITDLSFSFEIMNLFYKEFKENLIWIDHHHRIDKEIEKKFLKNKINGIRNHNFAACVLVWKFFKKEAPSFVKYVQDMDLWKFAFPDSKDFIAGIESFKGPFTKKTINSILRFIDIDYFNKKKPKIIEKGKIIREHQKEHVIEQLFYGKTINLFKTKAFIVNSIFNPGIFAETLFNQKKKKYNSAEILVIWYKEHNTNNFKFSLRRKKTSTIDLSLIAKQFNGGGHPGASGFTLKSLSDFKYE